MSNETNTAEVVQAIDDRIIVQSLTPEECVGKTVKGVWESDSDMVLTAFTDGTALIVGGEQYGEDSFSVDCDTQIYGRAFTSGVLEIGDFVKLGLIDSATEKELIARYEEIDAANDLRSFLRQPLFAVNMDKIKCETLLGVTFTNEDWVAFLKVGPEMKAYREQVSEQLTELTKQYYEFYKSGAKGTPSPISE